MTSKATHTTALIFAALKPQQTADNWLEAVQRHNIDWDDLVIRAIAFGLAPILHERLKTWDLSLPPKALAKLAITRKANGVRNEAIQQQLIEILAVSAEKNITPIALKGVHLAQHWYSDPSLRPMNDIDLLFRDDQMTQVDHMLTGLGYNGKWKSAELGPGITKHTSTYRRGGGDGATPNPYLSSGGDRTIEPHTSLEESWFGLQVDITTGMRERALTLPFGDQSGYVLDNEDLLLHLCVHLCFHLIMGAPSMVQLVDFLVVLNSGGRIDWPRFVDRANAVQAAPYAWAALRLVQNILEVEVSAETLQSLQAQTSTALQTYINSLTIGDILKRTQQPPLTTISQRIKRGFQDRAETARWAPNWRGRMRVWQTAFDVANSDTGRLILGKANA